MIKMFLCACLTMAALSVIFTGARMELATVKSTSQWRKQFAELFVKPPPPDDHTSKDDLMTAAALQAGDAPHGNECYACPTFVTFGVTNGGWRTTSGLRGMPERMNSTTIFANTIRLASHSLAHAHGGCWKLYVYTDEEPILRGEHGISLLGKEVEIRRAPAFVENVYDRMGQQYSGRPYDAIFETRKRGYQSISRCKLDLVQRHLDLGEKVIWMDLDTLIVSDMSCIYKELDHFVVAPGSLRNKDFQVLIYHNWTAPEGKSMPKWLAGKVPGKHFVFGDLWMANKDLIQAILKVETWMDQEYNARAQYDIQSYFSVLHYKNWTGLNDLARMEMWNNYSWGYQHIDGQTLPWARFSRNFHVGYADGTLLATNTCKKIGAMSWNWPSFQRMSYSP